jgi:hypothetical protein
MAFPLTSAGECRKINVLKKGREIDADWDMPDLLIRPGFWISGFRKKLGFGSDLIGRRIISNKLSKCM